MSYHFWYTTKISVAMKKGMEVSNTFCHTLWILWNRLRIIPVIFFSSTTAVVAKQIHKKWKIGRKNRESPLQFHLVVETSHATYNEDSILGYPKYSFWPIMPMEYFGVKHAAQNAESFPTYNKNICCNKKCYGTVKYILAHPMDSMEYILHHPRDWQQH